jgi:hypothetical protein
MADDFSSAFENQPVPRCISEGVKKPMETLEHFKAFMFQVTQ